MCVPSCLSPLRHYFGRAAFVVSLLHRIPLLKLRLSTADPRDIKAPCSHLLPVNEIKNRRDARLAITPTVAPPAPPSPNTPSIQPGIYIHVPCNPCTHTCQSSAFSKGHQAFEHKTQAESLSLSLFPLIRSPSLL